MNNDRDRIRQIIKEELSKVEIIKLIKDENTKLLKDKEFETKVKQISAKVIEELYKLLWQRKSFWADSINK